MNELTYLDTVEDTELEDYLEALEADHMEAKRVEVYNGEIAGILL